jgi:hypothetical protein
LKLDSLARINLISGANNTGKTALLEAIFLHGVGFNPEKVLSISGLRGLGNFKLELGGRFIDAPWTTLFHDLDDSRVVELIGRDESRTSRSVKLRVVRDRARLARIPRSIPKGDGDGKGTTESALSAEALQWEAISGRRQVAFLYAEGPDMKVYPPVPPRAPHPVWFLNARWHPAFREEAEWFGQLEIHGRQQELVEVLRLLEPRLRRLSTVLHGGEPMLHADLGGSRLLPLAVVGDGVLRLARLALHLFRAEAGVLLVDEVENGLHHATLRDIWSALGAAAKQRNVQLFATTHSRDCIEAAHQAFGDDTAFRLIRLDREDTDIRAVLYDHETLDAALHAGLEVR